LAGRSACGSDYLIDGRQLDSRARSHRRLKNFRSSA
jgi:hypothetical protein